MQFETLIKNPTEIQNIINFRDTEGFSLVSPSGNSSWFELSIAGASTTGFLSLMFHHDGDCECLALINLDKKTLDITGNSKYQITRETIELLLIKCFAGITSRTTPQ